jgi:hypothetical protein
MKDPRFGGKTPLFGCSGCKKDFVSLMAFDQHRVGRHDLEFPKYLEGRHCQDVDEHPDWLLDAKGRWTTKKLQAQAVKLAEHHRRALMEPSEATEAA